MYAILKGMPQISSTALSKFNEYMGYCSANIKWINEDSGELIASPRYIYEFIGEISNEESSNLYKSMDRTGGVIFMGPTARDLEDERKSGMYIEDVVQFLIEYCKSINHTGYHIELVPTDYSWTTEDFYTKNLPDRSNLQMIYEG